MKYSWKDHTDRKRHTNCIKRRGQARLKQTLLSVRRQKILGSKYKVKTQFTESQVNVWFTVMSWFTIRLKDDRGGGGGGGERRKEEEWNKKAEICKKEFLTLTSHLAQFCVIKEQSAYQLYLHIVWLSCSQWAQLKLGLPYLVTRDTHTKTSYARAMKSGTSESK